MAHSFQKFAETAQRMSDANRLESKITLCAAYLSSIQATNELKLAARFFVEGSFPTVSGKRVVIGSRTYSTAAANFCEIDYENVFKPCKEALKDAPETIEKLMRNIEAARQKRSSARLSLAGVKGIYEVLSNVSTRVDKQHILANAWRKMSPVELKYFIRIMAGRSLKIGFQTENMVTAISDAFHQPVSDVRYVHAITGSIGQTAVLAKNNQLSAGTFRLFHPISFMAGISGRQPESGNLNDYVVEEIFDGLRAQIHISGKKVTIYSRKRKDITSYFPKIVSFFANRNIPGLVMDGMICSTNNEEILSGQLARERLKTKKRSPKKTNTANALFIADDLIYFTDDVFLEKKLDKRRQLLTKLAANYGFPIAAQFECKNLRIVDKLLAQSLAHGSKGLIFKKKSSAYEYGRRSNSWMKVKKTDGALLAILLYAHSNSRRSGEHYQSFTVGINVADDERYGEDEFIPIGKIDDRSIDILKSLRKQIKELAIEKFGPTIRLRPQIVVEIAFDDIRLNKRTKANYVLRRPRFESVRMELNPGQTNTLKDVEQIFQKRITRKRPKQSESPSFYIPSIKSVWKNDG
jgi:DNA ligase-1